MENFTSGEIYNDSHFILDGAKKLVYSGEIQYYRMDPCEWKERIRKAKSALLNCISTYIPWSLYEQVKDEFKVTDYTDAVKYAAIARDLGIYIILKPSGFICNESNGGGFPGWMWNEKIILRTSHTKFLERIDKWLEFILPQLRELEITRGGNLFLVQLENEFGYENIPYILHYYNKARSLEITDPIVLNDNRFKHFDQKDILGTFDYYPSPNGNSLKTVLPDISGYISKNKGKPTFSSEYAAGWLRTAECAEETNMGHIPPVFLESLSTLAFMAGVSGLNYYMFSGGTDPGMQAAKMFPTRYWENGAICEWGELSEVYYRYKTEHALIQSFEKLIMEGKRENPDIEGLPGSFVVASVCSDSGRLISITSTLGSNCDAHFRIKRKHMDWIDLGFEPYGTHIIPVEIKLDSSTVLLYTTSNVLFHNEKLWILYDDGGKTGQIRIQCDSILSVSSVEDIKIIRTENITDIFYLTGTRDKSIKIGGVLFIITTKTRALHTWFETGGNKKTGVLISNLYYAELERCTEGVSVHVESEPETEHTLTYIDTESTKIIEVNYHAPKAYISADKKTKIEFMELNSGWENDYLGNPINLIDTKLGIPYEKIGEYNCGYGYYKSFFYSNGEVTTLLIPEINDWFDLFVNGCHIGKYQRNAKVVLTNLHDGRNEIAVRCYSTGIDKDQSSSITALGGTMLSFYFNPRNSQKIDTWERKKLSDAEETEFYADKDLLLSYSDDTYCKQIGLDIPALAESDGWTLFSVDECGETKYLNANVEFSGHREILDRAFFVIDKVFQGSKVLLEIQDVDLIYSFYLNGNHFGSVWQGWDVWGFENRPKYFDITDFVRFGSENILCFRCFRGPKGGGVMAPVIIHCCESCVEEKAEFANLDKGIKKAMNNGIGSWEKTETRLSNFVSDRLTIARGTFNYCDNEDLVCPSYICLDGIHDFALIYVNGIMVGKYFPLGTQNRFYLWKSWLKEGRNEVCIVSNFNNSADFCVSTGYFHVKARDNLVIDNSMSTS